MGTRRAEGLQKDGRGGLSRCSSQASSKSRVRNNHWSAAHLHASIAKFVVNRRRIAAEQFDILVGELEVGALNEPADLLTSRVAQHKAEVDMEVVALKRQGALVVRGQVRG